VSAPDRQSVRVLVFDELATRGGSRGPSDGGSRPRHMQYASAWSRVVPVLDGLGVPNVAVQLPSCLPNSEVDDADSLRSLLDEYGEEAVVLAGHSFGGMVLTQVGAHASVRHLVYVDAPMLEVGEAIFELMDGRVAEHFAASMQADDDELAFDADALSTYFQSRGWSAVDIQEFLSGLRPQRTAASVLTPTVACMANSSVDADHLRRPTSSRYRVTTSHTGAGRTRSPGSWLISHRTSSHSMSSPHRRCAGVRTS
jgi:pimeloyl-ACP methyl ester carboxylesterase